MMLNIRILFGNLIIYYYIHYRKSYIYYKKLDYLIKQSNYILIILFQALFA